MKIPARATLYALLLAGFIHAAQPAAAAPKDTHPRADAARVGVVASSELPAVQVATFEADVTRAVEYVTFVQQADAIVQLVRADEAAQYVAAVQQAEADAAAEAARQRAAATPAPAPRSSGAVGDCTGFAVPDYIIQRESGGNPNAVNPSSGAYGCSQTLPSHYYAGGACAGLDMYSVDGQRQCTYILSDGGRNLQPWAL